eukprot:scaffold3474_cov246-Pinguiococcus_pyrenoidosus.AAC.15
MWASWFARRPEPGVGGSHTSGPPAGQIRRKLTTPGVPALPSRQRRDFGMSITSARPPFTHQASIATARCLPNGRPAIMTSRSAGFRARPFSMLLRAAARTASEKARG